MKNIRKIIFLSLVFLMLCSCSKKEEDKIKIDGSATVMPITQSIVEDFSKDNRDIEISVACSGTGGGFSKFYAGETDLQNASRKIKDKEITGCINNKIEFLELEIAKDAIIIAVNKKNNFLNNLDLCTLKKIFISKSNVHRWSDIDKSYPNELISFYIPSASSGTYDYFKNQICNKIDLREDVTSSQDMNLLLQGIEGNPNSIGFFSYSYYLSKKNNIKALSIEDVFPEYDNILNDKYKYLTRKLYLYLNLNKYKQKENLRKFVSYYISNAEKISKEEGFISLKEEEYLTQKNKLNKIN